jgi:hypothetical protein
MPVSEWMWMDSAPRQGDSPRCIASGRHDDRSISRAHERLRARLSGIFRSNAALIKELSNENRDAVLGGGRDRPDVTGTLLLRGVGGEQTPEHWRPAENAG